jgi:hypothetical protein
MECLAESDESVFFVESIGVVGPLSPLHAGKKTSRQKRIAKGRNEILMGV